MKNKKQQSKKLFASTKTIHFYHFYLLVIYKYNTIAFISFLYAKCQINKKNKKKQNELSQRTSKITQDRSPILSVSYKRKTVIRQLFGDPN